MVRVDAVDLRPALAADGLESGLDVLERLINLLPDVLAETWLTCKRVPAACCEGQLLRVPWRSEGLGPTLSGNLDAVTDADGLVEAHVLKDIFAEAGVYAVFEIRHSVRCVVGVRRVSSSAVVLW